MGVACKVLIPYKKLKYREGFINHIYGNMPEDQEHTPKWLLEINQDFKEKTGETLSHLNDKPGLEFSQIADMLEAVYIHKVNLKED